MEGLLTRCRVLPTLATCSCQLSRYVPRRLHHCAPGRGQRLVLSRMFQPQNLREDQVLSLEGKASNLTCKSQRLMLQVGLIHPASPGCYHLLPYTVRALEKLVRVIDQEMQGIGGQKVNMPSLSPAELWQATNRWDLMGKELLRLRDRHGKEYCLGPTHEEAVTALIASQKQLSYKQLPFLLYQVTRKFRDEPRPRFGLLRGREFYMKDMYTFDSSPEAARQTYGLVCDAYCSLFGRLGLRFIKVQADVGSIGGTMSHEFQFPVDVGEDHLAICPSCSFSANMETLDLSQMNCPACQSPLTETKGIEVGHTFYLGTKYSSIFNAQFTNVQGKPSLAEMGCYGLGVTRILAAAIEVLSTDDCIRWPHLLAPYQVCLIPPKKGSREAEAAELTGHLYDHITEAVPQLCGEVLLDDRTHLTIGNRLKDANKLGYPFVIIAGKRALEDPAHFEVWCQNTGEVVFLTKEGLVELLTQVQMV
ncbi:probable proline--tRNA ligase, mitochondrial [Nycticebus coucang]|uniref:probable proline--tRNA ligase, mitochondrial n=1 Tax=Nycticebus coucang TaxID=9470 RepID=UPI00234CEF2B|nr:probable proline--tRNA ligase, mitochondrial [Nycticebus coucang]XP_053432925.1 probable proline--tRNA ligase, mitochondrial [Nycticebus coucang]XP_053432926.1 probable proline--tRNA ligase, mitochondrial [Nycticebus coucang]XP_053432927.1 probable proline--tRNA ligase, mitochondrial [Nycticebus coucang]XP_053432928.1 probable proline--tRNA ligase, mitochondrial [Nycticebus coucang]XP_053432929.1 probable proline--tRNA ligase, mitochondrial [Nycticebus coucang]